MTTSVASGSQSATVGTEHTLATITTAGNYVLVVDMNAMLNGDYTELRIKTKAKSGGTSRLYAYAIFAHIQAELNKCSIPVAIDVEAVFTLKQIFGTGRTYDWNVLQL